MPLAIAAVAAGLVLVFSLVIRHARKKQRVIDSHIDNENLNSRIKRGEPLTIIDLRHPLEVLAAPQVIPGAVHIDPAKIELRAAELSPDADVVLYCTCPNAETSMKVMNKLQQRGFRRVRALTGGLPGWKEAGFPVQELYPELQEQISRQSSL